MDCEYMFPGTEKAIAEFLETIISGPDMSAKTQRDYQRRCHTALSPYLSDMDIADMDRFTLGKKISCIVRSQLEKGPSEDLYWIRRFLFFLVDTGYYEDRRFDFLRHCTHYFPGNNAFLIDALLGKAYQYDSTTETVHGFLDSVLEDEERSELSRRQLYREAKKYLQLVLGHIDVDAMDHGQLGRILAEVIEDIPAKEHTLVFKHVRRFLYYLIDCKFYKDRRFDYLLHYREYSEKANDTRFLLKLLLYEHYFQHRVATLQNGNRLLIFINSKSESVCNVVAEAFGIYTHGFDDVVSLNEHFDESLQPYMVESVYDCNWRTFQAQCSYLHRKQADRCAFSYLITIYNLIAQKYNMAIFDDGHISPGVLSRLNLAKMIYEGYELCPFNPMEKAPDQDKLIICFSPDTNKTNTSNYASNSRTIDFSTISATEYKSLLKDYLWHAAPAFESKINTCTHVKLFFDYLDDLRQKKVLSIYYTPHDDARILPGECMAYVQYVREHYNNIGTGHAYIKAARLVLQYAIDMNYTFVDPLSTFYLKTYTEATNSAKPLDNEELRKLSAMINEKSQGNTKNTLMACLFYMLLTTEFRISQLVTLDKNCIKSTMKRGEYVLVSTSKTSYGEQTETPVTSETKRHIDLVISLTEKWREECSDRSIADKLFIIPAHRRNTFTLITTSKFNEFFAACCHEAGIPQYTASNLRDTHMTKAEEVRIRNNMSDIDMRVLTGHSSTATSERHYIKTDVISLLEASYGLVIGDVQVEGQVSNDGSTPADVASVANQCGYCGKDACESYSYLSCLMCRNFIATRAQLPFFNSEIARIEAKIQNTTTPHDIEDLRNIQRLLLAYLAQLLQEEDIHVLDSKANPSN